MTISTAELCRKIFDFTELICGMTMYPYQRQVMLRIIRSVLENDGKEITILQARQSGKSQSVSCVVTGMLVILPVLANMPMFAGDKRLDMFKRGLKVLTFAPIERQAGIIFSRIKNMLIRAEKDILADPDLNMRVSTSNGTTVALTNGSSVICMTASENSNVEGESAMLILLDEAQDIGELKAQKSIKPMASAYNGSTIMIGTPTRATGFFYKTIQRNISDAERGESPKNHFQYDYLVASKYNEKYAKYVEEQKKNLGEDSIAFRTSYKLEWIKELSLFCDIGQFEMYNTDVELDLLLQGNDRKTYVAGIDVGGKYDSTIVTIREVNWNIPVIAEERIDELTGETYEFRAYNTYLRAWLELRDVPDYNEQYFLIQDFLDLFNPVRIVCDATREKSLCDRIAANRNCEVIPFIFSLKSKSELYKLYDAEISSRRARIAYSDDAQLQPEMHRYISQLGNMEREYKGAFLVCHHPEIENAHDDYVDSDALSVLAAQNPTAKPPKGENYNMFTAHRRDKFKRSMSTLTARRR